MIKKALKWIVLSVVLCLIATVLYLFVGYPAAGVIPQINAKTTQTQIERGKYLANHVSVCIDCHSERDWSIFSGPPIKGTYGKGGELFDEKMGLPGSIYAKNITPYNLEDWSDGEIYHVITTGINKKGEAIFPLMPYRQYRYMDPRDIEAIIAYIRTLDPIEHDTPETVIDFPVNLIMRTFPEPASPVKAPSPSDTVNYGKYMTTISACTGCHTPENNGTKIQELYMAGGFEFKIPGAGTVRSANITPHLETGIGAWSEQQFVDRFKMYEVPVDSLPLAKNLNFETVMPWKMYAGMTASDLRAIYAYLETLEPIQNEVEKYTPEGK